MLRKKEHGPKNFGSHKFYGVFKNAWREDSQKVDQNNSMKVKQAWSAISIEKGKLYQNAERCDFKFWLQQEIWC